MKSIHIETIHDCIADHCTLRKRIIKDIIPIKKRGVTGYHIECYKWYGKYEYVAIIDAFWFCETTRVFKSLRYASDWIKEIMLK